MRRGKLVKTVELPKEDPTIIKWAVPKGIPVEIPRREEIPIEIPTRKEEKHVTSN